MAGKNDTPQRPPSNGGKRVEPFILASLEQIHVDLRDVRREFFEV